MNFKSSLASVGKSSQASGSQGNFNTASFGVSSQVNNVFSTNVITFLNTEQKH